MALSGGGRRPRIGIVGGGASGTLVAAHLLRSIDFPVDLVVFEPRERLGEGVAYSTVDPHHLLNVPARGMSAFPEDPDHFRAWVGAEPNAFLQRRQYADYLRAVLADALAAAPAGSDLQHLREYVTDLGTAPSAWVTTSSGSQISFDHLVLATGNDDPVVPDALSAMALPTDRLITDPWVEGALDGLGRGELVLIVGSGLTGVDIAMTLAASVRGVRIEMISRHGLIPATHDDPWQPGHPAPDWDPTQATPRDVLAYIRSFGSDWRRGLDSLRPITAALWQAWDARTQDAFTRHLARYWDVHRHRMAPQVGATFGRLQRAGRLRVHAATLISAVSTTSGIDVLLSCGEQLRVDRVIVCTGPTGRLERDPLGRVLVARGLARPGPLGVGYLVEPQSGAVLNAIGGVHSNVTAIGPLRRGVLWESTAIPEIRRQAADLADQLGYRSVVAA